MKSLIPFCLIFAFGTAVAAAPTDSDALLGMIKQVEKSLPLDVKRVNAITKSPVRNWSAAQVKSADNANGPLLRVEGGLDEKSQLTSLSMIAGAKTKVTPKDLEGQFGKWTGERTKPITSPANPKPVVYFYERPWGDIDFEFASAATPPTLRTVTLVPYKREKASGLSRRSKLSTPSK